MSFGRVIKVGDPLSPLPESPIWSSHVSIRQVKNNGTVEYKVEITQQPKANDRVDEAVRKHLNNAITELSQQP